MTALFRRLGSDEQSLVKVQHWIEEAERLLVNMDESGLRAEGPRRFLRTEIESKKQRLAQLWAESLPH